MRAYLGLLVVAFGTTTQINPAFIVDDLVEHKECKECLVRIDTSFIEYWSEFISEAEKRNLKINRDPIVIKFHFVDNYGVVGVCSIFPDPLSGDRRAIFIDKIYWEKISRSGRRAVIFHELAHCLLNVESHSESGIMSQFVPLSSDGLLEDFWAYVTENSRDSI